MLSVAASASFLHPPKASTISSDGATHNLIASSRFKTGHAATVTAARLLFRASSHISTSIAAGPTINSAYSGAYTT
jgi:hypothetical protein